MKYSELSERERDEIFRAAATLAKRAADPDFYLDLARCYTVGKCTALRYDEKRDAYVYTEVNVQREVPASAFQEHAYMVCRRSDGSFRYVPLKPLPGQLGARVNASLCYPDRPVGVIHTHPAGAVFPSGADLYVLSDLSAMCISGKMKDKSGEYYRVFCAFPYPWVDREDLARIVDRVDSTVERFVRHYEDVLSLAVFDREGFKYMYVFPPGTASAYLVDKIREQVKDFMDVEYRVYRPGEFEEVKLP